MSPMKRAVGQVLGAVSRAQMVDIRFADFKSAGTGHPKMPDVVMASYGISVVLKAVGEVKVPSPVDR